jgi:uncharacterized protein YdiU (UPF0061 family)
LVDTISIQLRRIDLHPESSLRTDLPRLGWNLEDSYARLPPVFFQEIKPATVSAPDLCVVNRSLDEHLGLCLGDLPDQEAARLLTGQQLPPGAKPIAQAYAGHQFGGFTMLGDGRAILLGEQRAPSGELFDIQLKGSGRTPFSRGGDGRAALGPMLREYIISESLAALAIPTTRSLAVATTGDPVYRETPLRGAILTRVASSHLRVGTFQYAAASQEVENLRALADYAIARHYPELVDDPQMYLQFLRGVMDRQASLIVRWQLVGFIHGVMNTDNMTISGESIDFGPCAFMDAYDPTTRFSSIDHGGRYAYGNQPGAGEWNVARFAETLLPLLDENQDAAVEMATDAINGYPAVFQSCWIDGMRKKLGLQSEEDGDVELIEQLLDWMQEASADFTKTFDDLSTDHRRRDDLYRDEQFQSWHARWRGRVDRERSDPLSSEELMRSVNPSVIPRNQRVEEALRAATRDNDLSVMERLLAAMQSTYERDEKYADMRSPPPSGQSPYCTFCGT